MISTDLNVNIARFEALFFGSDDLVKRKFPAGESGREVYIVYFDGLSDRQTLERQIITSLMSFKPESGGKDLQNPAEALKSIENGGMATADMKEVSEFKEAVSAVMAGDAAVFISGCGKAVVIAAKGWPSRGVPQVETEPVVFGSKEAFSESLRTNTTLIRRRIRDTRLKVNQLKLGARSGTDAALMYIEDLVRPGILAEARKRLESLNTDAVLDSGSLAQLIEDDRWTIFPQVQLTERPDKAASAVLEGRVAVIVDNSPFVLLIPAPLNVFYQASDDYYQRFHAASLARLLRFAAGLIAVALPGLYLAIDIFHPTMLPTLLILKLAGARQNIPFPAIGEVLFMDAAFTLLLEAGIRLPKPIGSSIGIIGGLIMGQAAVEAGLVCPIVVIITAVTGIAAFTIPNYSIQLGFRLAKYLVIILSGLLGILGFWAGMIILLVHLASLKSFGFPYLFPLSAGGANHYSDLKDSFFRAPLFMMKKRPIFANPNRAERTGKEAEAGVFKER